MLAAHHLLPQHGARKRIEGKEIAFTAAGENEVRRRRQDSATGDVRHLELPFDVAALGINCLTPLERCR